MNPKFFDVELLKMKHYNEQQAIDTTSSQTVAKPNVSCRLLLRIAADLQKEYIRQTDDMVKADLETQIEGLKALYKEVEDYRTIRRLLNGSQRWACYDACLH